MRNSLLRNLGFALTGVYATFKSERNFRIHVVAMSLAVALGLYLGLALVEWGLIILSGGLVMGFELFNTAVERLGDEVARGEQVLLVKNAKDIAAGAVLLSVLAALLIGILFLGIPLVRSIAGLVWATTWGSPLPPGLPFL